MNFYFGFSIWKHTYIAPFFDEKPIFINPIFGKNHLKKALSQGMSEKSNVYIWGKKSFLDVENYLHDNKIKIFRVEDGFIRSIGLGSDLTQPYSLIVDSRGIYFDPNNESDLEYILQNHVFSQNEITRSKRIRQYLIDKKLSKYNIYKNIGVDFPKGKQVVVVPGQVEDDASIQYGARGMTNLELLQQVRINRPHAYIVYKPHPDVLVGNRVGSVDQSQALQYCDQIVTKVGIDSVLRYADEVHTMTSLVGFEALIRGIKVITYGLPFYAGWGLSEDHHRCERRSRKLSIDELMAGTYLLYPRYIHPETLKRCEIEEVLEFLERKREEIQNSLRSQWRNWISRKLQAALRGLKGVG